MRMSALFLSAAALAFQPALAQTAAPSSVATPPAAASGSPTLKSVRQACRGEIKGHGLKGDAHRQAMVGCMTEAMPDRRARIACMFDPKLKGMDRAARHAFVEACAAKAAG